MSGDYLRQFKKGEDLELSARTLNAWTDAAKKVQNRRSSTEKPKPATKKEVLVFVVNNSGSDLPVYSILGVDGPRINPDTHLDEFLVGPVMFNGITPAVDTHENLYLVLQQPIASGAGGWALMSGLTRVKIKKEANTEFVDIDPGNTSRLIKSSSGNAQVIWENAGTVGSDVWALVRIGGGGGASCPPKNAIQQIFMLGQVTSGSFILGLDTESTTALAYNSTSSQIQSALEALSNIGAGNVQVTGSGLPTSSMLVEFIGSLANTLMPPMFCNINSLSGIGAGMLIVPYQQGGS